jgi:hypothetical protein
VLTTGKASLGNPGGIERRYDSAVQIVVNLGMGPRLAHEHATAPAEWFNVSVMRWEMRDYPGRKFPLTPKVPQHRTLGRAHASAPMVRAASRASDHSCMKSQKCSAMAWESQTVTIESSEPWMKMSQWAGTEPSRLAGSGLILNGSRRITCAPTDSADGSARILRSELAWIEFYRQD